MKSTISGMRTYLLMLIGWILTIGIVWAYEGDAHKSVAGMDIYIGMIPTEVIQRRDLPKESKMHGGAPQGRNQYHLVVALFDAETGVRILDAKITANIAALGAGGNTKILGRMKIDDVVTFGNYFALPVNMPYRIRLKLDVPGKEVTEALFKSNGIVR